MLFNYWEELRYHARATLYIVFLSSSKAKKPNVIVSLGATILCGCVAVLKASFFVSTAWGYLGC